MSSMLINGNHQQIVGEFIFGEVIVVFEEKNKVLIIAISIIAGSAVGLLIGAILNQVVWGSVIGAAVGIIIGLIIYGNIK